MSLKKHHLNKFKNNKRDYSKKVIKSCLVFGHFLFLDTRVLFCSCTDQCNSCLVLPFFAKHDKTIRSTLILLITSHGELILVETEINIIGVCATIHIDAYNFLYFSLSLFLNTLVLKKSDFNCYDIQSFCDIYNIKDTSVCATFNYIHLNCFLSEALFFPK